MLKNRNELVDWHTTLDYRKWIQFDWGEFPNK